jgi:hypothetical protein
MGQVRPRLRVVASGNGTVRDLEPEKALNEQEKKHEEKLVYIIFSVYQCENGSGPLIKGKYDVFACPWKGSIQLFEEYTDSLEIGEEALLSMAVMEWTESERDAWFRANGAEVETDR